MRLGVTHVSAACIVGLAIAFLPAAHADEPAAAEMAAGAASPGDQLQEIVIHAERLRKQLRQKSEALDEARDKDLLPKIGATQYNIGQQDVAALPQGKNTPLDKVLLQAPGVSYDSAISNPDFHVRNEYSNVQYRINGIQLPDGVSALGPVLETGFVGNLNLLDGALPAQYGLRTAGVVDISAKSQFDPGGNLDIFAGSRDTFSPSIEYGGSAGQTQYFATARYLQSDEGLENAMPTVDPIHDRTAQERLFGYGSTLVGDSSRLTYIGGAWLGSFQIPNVAGLSPLGDFGPPNLSSTLLNENETDRFAFAVVALQSKYDNLDTQLSVFTRYAAVNFVPDVYYDLAFNDVASNVIRKSVLSGSQFDVADHLSGTQTLRAGVIFSVEQTEVDNLSTVLPLDSDGNPLPTPFTVDDYRSKLGWTLGGYVQDEWTIRPDLTLNSGLRFDQMNQYVSAGQLSPRLALLYQPLEQSSLHAGVARYFTPPMQVEATPNNLALFQNTTQQQAISQDDPVRPERATYVDVGLDQKLSAALTAGVDLYYKHATDQLDDGQFGQAVVLDQFNYARGFSRGAELKLDYQRAGLRAYANVSHEVTMAKEVNSNQYLIGDPLELAYLAGNYTPTSDAQTVTSSFGSAYRWGDMLASIDGLYGSGLRMGFANLQHAPGYTQWNAAVVREFYPWSRSADPLSLRLSVVNLFDHSYLLRPGTGIGEFAPQYGPRRGLFAAVTQHF